MENITDPRMRRLPPIKWIPAVEAGLMSGAILLVFPQGIPWSGLSLGSLAIMGRTVPELGVAVAIFFHLFLAVIYSVAIAGIVRGVRSWGGITLGTGLGLFLYLLNRVVVFAIAPQFIDDEARVIFAHAMFSLFAAAIYKGMTRRRPENFGNPAAT